MRPKGAVLIIAVALGFAVHAQSPGFDVAAIRLNTSPPPQMSLGPGLRNGRLTAANVTLRRILAVAYGMTEPRIIGPGWLEKDRFDMAGKSPDGVPDSELKPMLQLLLQDRFKLATHRETRDMAVYDLVVAKGGVKMAVYPALQRPPDDPNLRGGAQMRASAKTSQISDNLTFFVERPVIDKTGLTERYNYFLTFTPLSAQASGNNEITAPDLFTAIQKQLGLKLESARDNVEVVVVDHMELQPTEN